MVEEEIPSGGTSATQTPPSPVTGTASGSATPPAATLTLEEALKRIADLEHTQKNATEEVERHRKKLTAYEKKEQEADAAKKAAEEATLSEIERVKKQYAELEEQRDTLASELFNTRVRQEVADLKDKFHFVVSAKTLANLLLMDESAIEFENGHPTNIEKLLDQLAKTERDLVREPEVAQQQGQQGKQAPPVPAMNPGRTNIPAPNQLPPGQRPRIPRLTDNVFVPPGTVSPYQP